MKRCAWFLCIALCACATTRPITVSWLQAACDKETHGFVANAGCIAAVMRHPDMPAEARNDAALQLYTAQAEALAARVTRGAMTEAEARYEQLALRVQIEKERQHRADAAGDALIQQYMQSQRDRKARGGIVTCSRFEQMVNCY